MKTWVYLALILFAVPLQTTVLGHISLRDVEPDIVLVAVVLIGLLAGEALLPATQRGWLVLIALVIGGTPALLQPISGHLIAQAVASHQPAKLAAMEALFITETGADFVLFGLPDTSTQTVDYAVVIPNGLSLLLHGDPQAVVAGLDQIPRQDWPPVAVTHVAFQLMVLCGMIMAAVVLWAGWRGWQGRLEADRWLLRALVVTAPFGLIAIQAGWVVTEVGRQPWVIQGVVRTSEAVTPMPGLWIPMVTFSALYLVLSGVVVWAIRRHVAAVSGSSPERVEHTERKVA